MLLTGHGRAVHLAPKVGRVPALAGWMTGVASMVDVAVPGYLKCGFAVVNGQGFLQVGSTCSDKWP